MKVACVPWLPEAMLISVCAGALLLLGSTVARTRKAIKILRNLRADNVVEFQQLELAMAGLSTIYVDEGGGEDISAARAEAAKRAEAAAKERKRQEKEAKEQERARAATLGAMPAGMGAKDGEEDKDDGAAAEGKAHAAEGEDGSPLGALRKAKREKEEAAENAGKFVLQKSVTCLSSIIVLNWTFFAAYTILILRLTTINSIPQQVALILSILTIFIAGTEGQAKEKIKEPSSYIFASVILKCMKAVMIIIVFSCNGNLNDYFVSFFFLSTSLCGLVYLHKAGYRMPEELAPEEEDDPVKQLQRKIVEDLIQKEQDAAFLGIAAVAFGFFFAALVVVYEGADIFGQEEEVSTMGISASIMIMINVVSWPHIMETIRGLPRLSKIKDPKKRAQQFLAQIDDIVEFCSGLMNQIKDLAGGDDEKPVEREEDEMDEAHRKHMETLMELCSNQKENNKFQLELVGGIAHITDRQKVTIVECNLKRKNEFVREDLRLEGEEESGSSKLEQLVVFEQNVYVMMSGKEYVFRKGSVFSEGPGAAQDKNVQVFTLVTPSAEAPLSLRLTPRLDTSVKKLPLAKDRKVAVVKDEDKIKESEMTEEMKNEAKAKKDKDAADLKAREIRDRRAKMRDASNPNLENDENYTLLSDWLEKFIETNGVQLEEGGAQIEHLLGKTEDATEQLLQFHLQDYNARLDLKEVMLAKTHKGKKYFKKLENEENNVIEAVMFYTDRFMIVKLCFRKQIYCFVKGGLFNQDERESQKSEQHIKSIEHELLGKIASAFQDDKSEKNESGEKTGGGGEAAPSDVADRVSYRLITMDRKFSLVMHCSKMSVEEKIEYQQKQFVEQSLDIFKKIEHPDPEVYETVQLYEEQREKVNWNVPNNDDKQRKIRRMFKFRDGKSKYQGEWLQLLPGFKEYQRKDIDGRGVFLRKDGYRYDGFFRRGLRHGFGREVPTGLHKKYNWIFAGDWEDDERKLDSNTKYFWKFQHQQILDGAWKEVKDLIKGTPDDLAEEVIAAVDIKFAEEKFDFCDAEDFDGSLHIRNAFLKRGEDPRNTWKGKLYMGEWKYRDVEKQYTPEYDEKDAEKVLKNTDLCKQGDAVPSGRGIMVYPDGEVFFGEFRNGERHGGGWYIQKRPEHIPGDLKTQESYHRWYEDTVSSHGKVQGKIYKKQNTDILVDFTKNKLSKIIDESDEYIKKLLKQETEDNALKEILEMWGDIDWVKLGKKSHGVFEIRQIDKLNSDSYFFFGEWDLTENRPGGRIIFYIKNTHLYMGLSECRKQDEYGYPVDYDDIDFTTQEHFQYYLSKHGFGRNYISDLVEIPGAILGSKPLPWQGKYYKNKKYRLCKKDYAHQEKTRYNLLDKGLETLRDMENSKMTTYVYDGTCAFNREQEEDGVTMDWRAILRKYEAWVERENDKGNFDHYASWQDRREYQQLKREGLASKKIKLLNWKPPTAPSESQSGCRYLGEWLENADGTEEPYGRGWILYDDGSLYYGIVRFDREQKIAEKEGFGRFVPAKVEEKKVEQAQEEIDPNAVVIKQKKQRKPWSGYWYDNKKTRLSLESKHTKELEDTAQAALKGGALTSLLEMVGDNGTLQDKFTETDKEVEEIVNKALVGFDQSKWILPALDTPEYDGRGDHEAYPIDCSTYRVFHNQWTSLAVNDIIYWYYLGEWTIDQETDERLNPDGRGWMLWIEPGEVKLEIGFTKRQIKEFYSCIIPFRGNVTLPYCGPFSAGEPDCDINFRREQELFNVKQLNNWKTILTEGNETSQVKELYINLIEKENFTWKEIEREWPEKEVRQKWEEFERKQYMCRQIQKYQYVDPKGVDEKRQTYYGEWYCWFGDGGAAQQKFDGRGYRYTQAADHIQEGFLWGNFTDAKPDGYCYAYPPTKKTKAYLYETIMKNEITGLEVFENHDEFEYTMDFKGQFIDGERCYTDSDVQKYHDEYTGMLQWYLNGVVTSMGEKMKKKFCFKGTEDPPYSSVRIYMDENDKRGVLKPWTYRLPSTLTVIEQTKEFDEFEGVHRSQINEYKDYKKNYPSNYNKHHLKPTKEKWIKREKEKLKKNWTAINSFEKRNLEIEGKKGVYFGEISSDANATEKIPNGRGIFVYESVPGCTWKEREIFYGWFVNGKKHGYGRRLYKDSKSNPADSDGEYEEGVKKVKIQKQGTSVKDGQADNKVGGIATGINDSSVPGDSNK